MIICNIYILRLVKKNNLSVIKIIVRNNRISIKKPYMCQ